MLEVTEYDNVGQARLAECPNLLFCLQDNFSLMAAHYMMEHRDAALEAALQLTGNSPH